MIRRKVLHVDCTVEIENSFDSLHAHVDLGDFQVSPGDTVIVHDAPESVPLGEKRVFQRRATVIKARWFDRFLAKAEGYMELTELYEVGFEGKAS